MIAASLGEKQGVRGHALDVDRAERARLPQGLTRLFVVYTSAAATSLWPVPDFSENQPDCDDIRCKPHPVAAIV